MRKVLIFGNSGSGKSTLAKAICKADSLTHLDLDTLAWQPTAPLERRPLEESLATIKTFIQTHRGWVIEGCYADLLEQVLHKANEIIYLNLPVADCIANAKSRPWEAHKYPDKESQDANLIMLIEWISQYPQREDTFSQLAHQRLYDQFIGTKTQYTKNPLINKRDHPV